MIHIKILRCANFIWQLNTFQENKEKYELEEEWDKEKDALVQEHEKIMAELREDCEEKRKILQEDWETLVSLLSMIRLIEWLIAVIECLINSLSDD